MTKIRECYKCKELKPETVFVKAGFSSEGKQKYAKYCKICYNDRQRMWGKIKDKSENRYTRDYQIPEIVIKMSRMKLVNRGGD